MHYDPATVKLNSKTLSCGEVAMAYTCKENLTLKSQAYSFIM